MGLCMQGKVEAYGSQSELLSQGVNPAHLLGLMKEKEERDEFAYESDEEEEEEEEEKGKGEYTNKKFSHTDSQNIVVISTKN